MKIYVLSYGLDTGEDWSVIGVFDKEKKAKAVQAFYEAMDSVSEFMIEEMELNNFQSPL